jgi:hypothetical protein
MKNFFCFILCFYLLISLPLFSSTAELSPNYAESLQLAITHTANIADWRPPIPSLFVIPDISVGTTEGLVYDGGKLIVRTATKSRNFKWDDVGEAGYKIYGPAATHAAWE